MSLSNIKGKLTRSELKNIMAGSGVYTGSCGDECDSDDHCGGNKCPKCDTRKKVCA